jgi:hypothetical protein
MIDDYQIRFSLHNRKFLAWIENPDSQTVDFMKSYISAGLDAIEKYNSEPKTEQF